eukprot:746354-Hanusia_phi.AAC.2
MKSAPLHQLLPLSLPSLPPPPFILPFPSLPSLLSSPSSSLPFPISPPPCPALYFSPPLPTSLSSTTLPAPLPFPLSPLLPPSVSLPIITIMYRPRHFDGVGPEGLLESARGTEMLSPRLLENVLSLLVTRGAEDTRQDGRREEESSSKSSGWRRRIAEGGRVERGRHGRRRTRRIKRRRRRIRRRRRRRIRREEKDKEDKEEEEEGDKEKEEEQEEDKEDKEEWRRRIPGRGASPCRLL